MTQAALRKTARHLGIATSYVDYKGERVFISDDILTRFISAISKESISDLRLEAVNNSLPPVILCWDKMFPGIWIWLNKIPDKISAVTTGDEEKILDVEIIDRLQRKICGHTYWRLKIAIKSKIEFGYYELKIISDEDTHASFIISAPEKLKNIDKNWGIFAPAYAIKNDQGIGTYTDLYTTANFVKKNGGHFLGTLPLLPVNYEGGQSSPYSPISRLFWDEIFLDLARLPEFSYSPNSDFIGQSSHVEYPKIYSLKKDIIKQAALNFFRLYPQGNAEFKEFQTLNPHLDAYAKFRSLSWEDKELGYKYHRYAQYACHLQLREFNNSEIQLYLDYPVGVDASGFDAHYFKNNFMNGFSVGAPPDLLYSKGQNWGFCPLDPQEMIKTRFSYFRDCLEHHLRYCGMLRLDHVMGFYRIFCIPEGHDGCQGTYIHYPFKALLAVLCLEAWKHDAVLVGENLGTVPEAVNDNMRTHNILRMWVSQFEMKEDISESFSNIDRDMMASLNTHDLFPFEAFINNKDLEKLQELNIMDKITAGNIAIVREDILKHWKKEPDLFKTCIHKLAASSAACVIINIEDLWRETLPQNIPGTMSEHRNWSKIFSVHTEEWDKREDIKSSFKILNKYRERKS